MADKRKELEDFVDTVRVAAYGRELEILEQCAGIGREFLNPKEGPCPKCHGNTRFRLMDPSRGAVRCSHCFNNQCGDYFAAIVWMQGIEFMDAVRMVAERVHVSIPDKKKAIPESQFVKGKWNDMLASMWLLTKPGIELAALKRLGAEMGDYKGIPTIAFPVIGQSLDRSAPVGWIMYALSGTTLPKYNRRDDGGWDIEQVKCKVSYNCGVGIVGNIDEIKASKAVWKLEGTPDVAAFLSWNAPEVTAFTNSNGAEQHCAEWIAELVAGKEAFVVGDADKPGQKGADGKWGPALAKKAAACHVLKLPYPIADTHGKDVRDFKNEGGDYGALLSCQRTTLDSTAKVSVDEDMSDPFRLARENLRRYKEHPRGGDIRFWKEQFFRWRCEDGCWMPITESDLRAKVAGFIKAEFDRKFLEDRANGSKAKNPQHVTPGIISSVLEMTRSLVLLGSSVEQYQWVEDPTQYHTRHLIAVRNGLLDVEAILAGAPLDQVLLPHSSKWWSTICLPYEYDPSADCPKWEEYLCDAQNDDDAIRVLQEWSGYSILPSTDHQKFLCLEGEGANGKSVFLAGLRGIVGVGNCSDLSLEDFADQFAMADTIGKLLNISSDVGEIDKVGEGVIKRFADGSRVSMNRKGLSRVSASPTARLVMAFNRRPRFTDRSAGIWRRMLLVPFTNTVNESKRIFGMDKWEYWKNAGQLPGMLNWAIAGLLRLQKQRGFTAARCVIDALESYRDEANPCREFLAETTDVSVTGGYLTCENLYEVYEHWCRKTGRHKLAAGEFSKEVEKKYKTTGVTKTTMGTIPNRVSIWDGLRFIVQEVFGRSVEEKSKGF